MLVTIITVLAATLAQMDILFTAAMPPSDVPTFEVTVKGQSPFYAGVRIGGGWIKDQSTEIKPTQKVEFVVDNPFYTGATFSVLMRDAQIRYEAPAMRRARLERIWDENGYTFIETASGWKALQKRDIELAERARKMDAAATQTVPAKFELNTSLATGKEGGGTGARKMLLIRVAIILAGCAAGGVALKYIFRSQSAWNRLE